MANALSGAGSIFHIVCLLPFVLLEPVQAQRDITVRFLDFKSGKPIKNIRVEIDAWSGNRTKESRSTSSCSWSRDGKDASGASECEWQSQGAVVVRFPERQPVETAILIRASTDLGKDGRVVIHLPGGLPEHIEVMSWAACVDLAVKPGVDVTTDISPADVLKSGVVLPSAENRKPSKLQVTANGGEIVLLYTHGTFWQRTIGNIPFP
jgi:hypothetical protein